MFIRLANRGNPILLLERYGNATFDCSSCLIHYVQSSAYATCACAYACVKTWNKEEIVIFCLYLIFLDSVLVSCCPQHLDFFVRKKTMQDHVNDQNNLTLNECSISFKFQFIKLVKARMHKRK